MAEYKFGTLASDGRDVPFYYDDVYEVEETTGRPRLVIAPRDHHLDVMAELAEALEPPVYLLYVLLVGRTGRKEGRYQSPDAFEADDLREFLSTHGSFLEIDGRHHFWIASARSDGLLVYDQHNVIYAYGPLSRFEQLLGRRGFQRDQVRFPAPHTHHYHASCDSAEDRLFADVAWVHFPLLEQDEL